MRQQFENNNNKIIFYDYHYLKTTLPKVLRALDYVPGYALENFQDSQYLVPYTIYALLFLCFCFGLDTVII